MKTIIRSLKMTLLLSLLLPAVGLVIATVRAQESNTPRAESSATKSETTTQKVDTEWEGVSVELTGAKRTEGDSILIQFKFTNNGSKSTKLVPAYEHDNISEKVYYIDPKNKKKYTVIMDAEKNPVCSSIVHVTLEAGASRAGWTKLPAPPPDVTSITVYIPGAPPFEKVALTSQ